MAGPNRTQKQIAEKYKGNLDYFHKGHYSRRLRGFVFVLAVVGSIAAVATFRYWGKQDYFSTGPISTNHSQFAHDCQVCHEGANPDLLAILPLNQTAATGAPRTVSLDQTNASARSWKLPALDAIKLGELKAGKLTALAEQGVALTEISRMDRACLKCHDAMHLHQPQAEALQMRSVRSALPLVHTGSCAVCHREHVGAKPMELPGTESCASCHNNPKALAQTRELLPVRNPHLPARAENRDLGDRVLRFIAPPKTDAQPAVFESYEKGHPPFAYEQPNLRDPAVLQYNHSRHEQSDIPAVAGRKLDCTYCHRPTANGIFYQRVTFEEHCQTCHGLTIDPDIPQIAVPHGDAGKVRAFVAGLGQKYKDHFLSKGIAQDALLPVITEATNRLLNRGITSLPELERRVFFTGDPEPERISPRGNKTVFFPGCTKCHQVLPAQGDGVPTIVPTNMAERWVHGGPFTHVPHQHMDCTDCHAARQSKLTTDILMPAQKLCAECHRPFQRESSDKPLAGSSTIARAGLKPGSRELADAQRREGGVKWDCQSCHSFHAPPAAAALVNAEKK